MLGDCDSIIKVGSSCTLGCQKGYEFVDKMKRAPSHATHYLSSSFSLTLPLPTANPSCSSPWFVVSPLTHDCLCSCLLRAAGTGPAGLGARIKVPRHPYCHTSADEEFAAELQVNTAPHHTTPRTLLTDRPANYSEQDLRCR